MKFLNVKLKQRNNLKTDDVDFMFLHNFDNLCDSVHKVINPFVLEVILKIGLLFKLDIEDSYWFTLLRTSDYGAPFSNTDLIDLIIEEMLKFNDNSWKASCLLCALIQDYRTIRPTVIKKLTTELLEKLHSLFFPEISDWANCCHITELLSQLNSQKLTRFVFGQHSELINTFPKSCFANDDKCIEFLKRNLFKMNQKLYNFQSIEIEGALSVRESCTNIIQILNDHLVFFIIHNEVEAPIEIQLSTIRNLQQDSQNIRFHLLQPAKHFLDGFTVPDLAIIIINFYTNEECSSFKNALGDVCRQISMSTPRKISVVEQFIDLNHFNDIPTREEVESNVSIFNTVNTHTATNTTRDTNEIVQQDEPLHPANPSTNVTSNRDTSQSSIFVPIGDSPAVSQEQFSKNKDGYKTIEGLYPLNTDIDVGPFLDKFNGKEEDRRNADLVPELKRHDCENTVRVTKCSTGSKKRITRHTPKETSNANNIKDSNVAIGIGAQDNRRPASAGISKKKKVIERLETKNEADVWDFLATDGSLEVISKQPTTFKVTKENDELQNTSSNKNYKGDGNLPSEAKKSTPLRCLNNHNIRVTNTIENLNTKSSLGNLYDHLGDGEGNTSPVLKAQSRATTRALSRLLKAQKAPGIREAHDSTQESIYRPTQEEEIEDNDGSHKPSLDSARIAPVRTKRKLRHTVKHYNEKENNAKEPVSKKVKLSTVSKTQNKASKAKGNSVVKDQVALSQILEAGIKVQDKVSYPHGEAFAKTTMKTNTNTDMALLDDRKHEKHDTIGLENKELKPSNRQVKQKVLQKSPASIKKRDEEKVKAPSSRGNSKRRDKDVSSESIAKIDKGNQSPESKDAGKTKKSKLKSTIVDRKINEFMIPVNSILSEAYTNELQNQIFESITKFSDSLIRKIQLINTEINKKIIDDLTNKYENLFNELNANFNNDVKEMVELIDDVKDLLHLEEEDIVKYIQEKKFVSQTTQ